MTEVETRDIPLNWDVFVTAGIPTVTSDLPPGTEQGMWSPTSSTLIYGKRDVYNDQGSNSANSVDSTICFYFTIFLVKPTKKH